MSQSMSLASHCMQSSTFSGVKFSGSIVIGMASGDWSERWAASKPAFTHKSGGWARIIKKAIVAAKLEDKTKWSLELHTSTIPNSSDHASSFTYPVALKGGSVAKRVRAREIPSSSPALNTSWIYSPGRPCLISSAALVYRELVYLLRVGILNLLSYFSCFFQIVESGGPVNEL